jgi:hypothetical protein
VCGSDGFPCCGGNTCTIGCCVSRYSDGGFPTCVAEAKGCDSYASSSAPTCDVTSVAGGACTNGTTMCGGLNQPCCTSSYSSSSSYYYCAGDGTRCRAVTPAGTTTTQYTCMACGDKDQPCCVDTTSTSYSSGVPCKSTYLCKYGSSSTGTYTCTDATLTAAASQTIGN